MISSSSRSPQQGRLLQRALQVPVHLDVAVAQIHAHLVETLDQPGPVGAPHRLDAERRDGSLPLMAFLTATRGAHLPEEIVSIKCVTLNTTDVW